MTRRKMPTSFEDALEELEAIVNTLEKGDSSLEQSLKAFERGVKLTRTCETALKEAEQKVQILMQQDETAEPTLKPFAHEPE